jgi:hypothetical protein
MAKQERPTADERAKAIRVALSGIADGLELGDLAALLAPLHPKNNTFPGEVLLELAADAIEESGATREQPLESEGIRKRHLPEDRAHTKAQHHKADYALRAAAMVRAGVDPGLLDEVIWWRTDDLWFWALEALVIYVRLQPNAAPRPFPPSAAGSRAATTCTSQPRPELDGQNAWRGNTECRRRLVGCRHRPSHNSSHNRLGTPTDSPTRPGRIALLSGIIRNHPRPTGR